jgi:hypothetical protein
MLILRIQDVWVVMLGSRVIDSQCFGGTYGFCLQGSRNPGRILLRLLDLQR